MLKRRSIEDLPLDVDHVTARHGKIILHLRDGTEVRLGKWTSVFKFPRFSRRIEEQLGIKLPDELGDDAWFHLALAIVSAAKLERSERA